MKIVECVCGHFAHQRIGAINTQNGNIYRWCVVRHTDSLVSWTIMRIVKCYNGWQRSTYQSICYFEHDIVHLSPNQRIRNRSDQCKHNYCHIHLLFINGLFSFSILNLIQFYSISKWKILCWDFFALCVQQNRNKNKIGQSFFFFFFWKLTPTKQIITLNGIKMK